MKSREKSFIKPVTAVATLIAIGSGALIGCRAETPPPKDNSAVEKWDTCSIAKIGRDGWTIAEATTHIGRDLFIAATNDTSIVTLNRVDHAIAEAIENNEHLPQATDVKYASHYTICLDIDEPVEASVAFANK